MDINTTLLGINAVSEKCQAKMIETCMATCNGIEQRIAWFSLTVVIAMALKLAIKKHFSFENGELLQKKAGWTWCSGDFMLQLAKTGELYLDLIMWTTGI